MLKLLTVALESEKLQVALYQPTPMTIGVQLSHQPKGIIISVCEHESSNAFAVSLMELVQGQQRPTLKAFRRVYNSVEDMDADKASGNCIVDDVTFALCRDIINKYAYSKDQEATADHFALLINGKNPELKPHVNKDSQ